jgi:hypothetical protein
MTREALYVAQGGICPWCSLSLPSDLAGTEIDHIIPRSRGGVDADWNEQLLHWACNRGPGGKHSQLTEQSIALAAEHGISLHEPKPTSWPGVSTADATRAVAEWDGDPAGDIPALAGLAEVAALASEHYGREITRKRAYQLTQVRTFPEPVQVLASGSVWIESEVMTFLTTPRTAGRPRLAKTSTG